MMDLAHLEQWRLQAELVKQALGFEGGAGGGIFNITSPHSGTQMLVVASSADGWDHVSVSIPYRKPDWDEMARVKELFFGDGVLVMQLHMSTCSDANKHPHCLHLWRPHAGGIPMPPGWMVGGEGALKGRADVHIRVAALRKALRGL